MTKNHFLDSNIIISSLDYSASESKKYAGYIDSKSHTKIASKRAFDECKGYFNKNREALLKFLEHCFQNSGRISQASFEKDALGEATCIFTDRRDTDAAKKLVEAMGPEVRHAIFGARNDLDDFSAKIAGIFGNALARLTITCINSPNARIKRFDGCPYSYQSTEFGEEFRKLDEIIRYEKDSLVVMDARFFGSVLK